MKRKSERIKYTKEILDIIAEEHGGKFVDNQYKGTKEKHNWICYFNHHFEKAVDGIMQGEWCPICSKGKSEQFCRFCFEQLFQTPFPPTRELEWLRNSRGFKMELDGYSDKYNIAFEYQGKQHFEQINHFHPTKSQFESRVKDDQLKKELCANHGIKLFIISHDTPIYQIEDEILNQCNKFEIKPKLQSRINYSSYVFEPDDILKEMRDYAKINNGECLSEFCIDSQQRVKFKCNKHDYIWETLPSSIRSGRWCKLCGYEKSANKNRSKLTIDDMQKLAAKFGGECLSQEYSGSKNKLLWKCKNKNHPPFKQTPGAVKNGNFCRKCSGKERISIEDMRNHARAHGGICVSNELPEKGKSMIEFKCHNFPSHPSFFKRAVNIKSNSNLWCPNCKGGKIQKHSIEDIKELADAHNYECLSDEYINNHELMKWRCKECNYEWEAIFRQIQRKIKFDGTWCDKCIALNRIKIIQKKNLP